MTLKRLSLLFLSIVILSGGLFIMNEDSKFLTLMGLQKASKKFSRLIPSKGRLTHVEDYNNDLDFFKKVLGIDTLVYGPTDYVAYPEEAIILDSTMRVKEIINSAKPGSSFFFKAGTYRTGEFLPKSDMSFYGERGAVLNGSVILDDFVRVGNFWRSKGVSYQPGPHEVSDVCMDKGGRCNVWIDLYIDDKPLLHVNSMSRLNQSTWYYDFNTDSIYIAVEPSTKKIEISKLKSAFSTHTSLLSKKVTISNLYIEKFANRPQFGVIHCKSSDKGWLISNNVIRLNHGAGVIFGDEAVIKNNSIVNNGQLGCGGGGKNSVFECNELSANNFAFYDAGWEAGGSKFAHSEGLKVTRNFVYDNLGPGLWTDINNDKTLYEYNLVLNNTIGIFHEISYEAIIRDNIVINNTEVPFGQIWISTSGPVEIYRNIIITPGSIDIHPLLIHDDVRGQGSKGEWTSKEIRFSDNEVVFLGREGRLEFRIDPGRMSFFSDSLFRSDGNRYYMKTEFTQHFLCYRLSDKKYLLYWCDLENWRNSSGQDRNSELYVVTNPYDAFITAIRNRNH